MYNQSSENTYQKQPEKPSFCSRRVVRTYKKNEFENISLQKNLSRIEKERFNSGMIRLDNLDKLLKISAEIKKTKTSIAVSPDRRRFLLENGFKINCREYNIQDFMEIIDDATLLKKQRAKSAPPRLTKEKPMLRLSDYITAKQEEKKKKEDQHNIDKNGNDNHVDNLKSNTENSNEKEVKQLNKKLSGSLRIRKAPIFRTITPPLKGREVWKVHEEKEQEEITRKLSTSHLKSIRNYRPVSALDKRLKDREEIKRSKSPNPAIEKEINQEVENYRMKVLSKHKLNQEINKKTNKKILKNRHKSATVRPATQTVLEVPVTKETFPLSTPRRQRSRTEAWADWSKGSRNIGNNNNNKDCAHQSHRKLRSSTIADASFAQMQVTIKGQSLQLFVSKFK